MYCLAQVNSKWFQAQEIVFAWLTRGNREMSPLSVDVAVRVRPPQLTSSTRQTVPLRGQYGQFLVDKVHDESTSQDVVFSQSVLPVVNHFLQVTKEYVVED